MSEVKLFRLNSGEEVLAKVLETTSSDWTIKTPAIILPMGNGKLGLAPWLPYCDTDNMTIRFKAVAFVVTPKTALVNEYSSSFGSGLVTPDREVEAPQLKLVME